MIGVVRASRVLVAPPDDLWKTVKDKCGLDREEYERYYEGASRAVAIRLTDPTPFMNQISLDQLRCSWPEFRPPRSFAYLSGERIHEVWGYAGICFIRGGVG